MSGWSYQPPPAPSPEIDYGSYTNSIMLALIERIGRTLSLYLGRWRARRCPMCAYEASGRFVRWYDERRRCYVHLDRFRKPSPPCGHETECRA